MNKKIRKQIQMRIRKIMKISNYPYGLPDKEEIYKDDEFEIKFLGHKMSFGDTEMKFEAKDLKSGITYRVELTEYIRTERPYWYIRKKGK